MKRAQSRRDQIMNEPIKRVVEAMQQLPNENQNAIAECIEAMQKLSNDAQQVIMKCLLEEIKEQEPIVSQTRPLKGRELMEKLYREGVIENIPTREPLTEEEKAERARLAQLFAGGKSASEIVIEDRGPY